MAMHKLKSCQGFQSFFRSCSSTPAHGITQARPTTGGYYVLVPETPPDSADDNAALQFKGTPQFSVISPVRCITGCAKLAIDYETKLHKHLQALQDCGDELTFSQVFDPIEEISVPLNTTWRTSRHLNWVCGVDYTRAFQRLHRQVVKAKSERWNSPVLYKLCQDFRAKGAELNEFQQRLISLQLTKGRLNGLTVKEEDKKRFVNIQKILAHECANFRHKVMVCQDMFSHKIDDFSVLSEMPAHHLNAMAEENGSHPSRGPWSVTLQPHIYSAFMEYCSDRMLRWNAWNAYNNRASVNFVERNLGNHKLIEELRVYRKDIAEMLGYDTFAEMSIDTKMSGSLENVLDMIDSMRRAFWGQANEEIAELQKFASSEGFQHQLQMWDLNYWRRRQSQHLYDLDHNALAEFFPLEHVLRKLFELCYDLFNVTITERTGQVETCYEDVRYFELHDESGHHIGSFFFDPFARPGVKARGAWMEMGRERSQLLKTAPYSYFVMNLEKPSPSSSSSSGPVLLQFREVLTLFREFGQGLQQLMTSVPYSDLAGPSNMELDVLQVCGNFLQRWALEPSFLLSLSSHVTHGHPLPTHLLHTLLRSHHHLAAYDKMRQLYLTAFDLEMHLSERHWFDAMTDLWEDHMPVPLSPDDQHPCSFTQAFSDLPASYYAHLWADMVAADAFAAFKEAGFGNGEKVQSVGRRFKDTFLELGGGVGAGEVFRRFRGRDPSVHALLEEMEGGERAVRMQ